MWKKPPKMTTSDLNIKSIPGQKMKVQDFIDLMDENFGWCSNPYNPYTQMKIWQKTGKMTYSDECKDCAPLRGDDLDNTTKVLWRASKKDVCTADCMPTAFHIFFQLETLCVSVFTVEYFARFFTVWAVQTQQEKSTGARLCHVELHTH